MMPILNTLTRKVVEEALDKLVTFLPPLLPIANVQFVDFIVNDIWSKFTDTQLQAELLSLTDDELTVLPNGTIDGTQYPQLHKWCSRARSHTLEHLVICPTADEFLQEFGNKTSNTRYRINNFMSAKKMHEVEIMSEVIAVLATELQTPKIIDVGSGKGYLGSYLHLMHGLDVVGLDSRDVNTNSALRRAGKLKKHWHHIIGIKRNPEQQQMAEKCQVKWKNNNTKGGGGGVETTLTPGEDNTDPGLYVEEHAPNPRHSSVRQCRRSNSSDNANALLTENEAVCKAKTEKDENGFWQCSSPDIKDKPQNIDNTVLRASVATKATRETTPSAPANVPADTAATTVMEMSESSVAAYTPVTMHVSNETSLANVLSTETETGGYAGRLLLCGLHTCGPLAATSVRKFADDSSVHAICNVGCCYHLLTDEFASERVVGTATERGVATADAEPTFPMSDFLRRRRFVIGRNGRMLAAQAVERLSAGRAMPSPSLFYRAAIEVIANERGGARSDRPLGRLYSKFPAFPEYVRAAVRKMELPGAEPSDDECDAYWRRFTEHRRRLEAFFQYRVVLAPVVEATVLLDRVCYLLEQRHVGAVRLVRLFEQTISPRCYAIIAERRQS
ncbi:PREDICTED: methyltransferase-like protein 25 [Priapulus caudatus]|uniref:Methyltransferase-like protein 25 n=1 Tax=Priapulus caudatus TaxID=37621 RepID=A0ABM1FAE7_PRICU|nr:PREDICTED: methyltransferase-like protein 25 [Priapulus caudatus]